MVTQQWDFVRLWAGLQMLSHLNCAKANENVESWGLKYTSERLPVHLVAGAGGAQRGICTEAKDETWSRGHIKLAWQVGLVAW